MRLKLIVAGFVGGALDGGSGRGARAGAGRRGAGSRRSSRCERRCPICVAAAFLARRLYDAMTADQKAFVKSVLSGPRPDISGSLGVMIASPVFADLAQKTIAYARFAGREGYSVVPPKLSELAIIMGARGLDGSLCLVRASAGGRAGRVARGGDHGRT